MEDAKVEDDLQPEERRVVTPGSASRRIRGLRSKEQWSGAAGRCRTDVGRWVLYLEDR